MFNLVLLNLTYLSPLLIPEYGDSIFSSLALLISSSGEAFIWYIILFSLILLTYFWRKPLVFLTLLYFISPGSNIFSLFSSSLDLWTVPLHVGAVISLWVILVLDKIFIKVSKEIRTNLIFFSGFILFIGLFWNSIQGFGSQGWAWDWIESAPLALILSFILGPHLWTRTFFPYLMVFYSGLLQLGRGALTLSLHHPQPSSSFYFSSITANTYSLVSNFECFSVIILSLLLVNYFLYNIINSGDLKQNLIFLSFSSKLDINLKKITKLKKSPIILLQNHLLIGSLPLWLSISPWTNTSLYSSSIKLFWGGLLYKNIRRV